MGKFLHISFCRTILVPFSNPFIPTSFIKPHQIKQFTHPRSDSCAIPFFQFLGIKVCGGMGLTPVIDKEFMPGEEDFAHDVAILTKVAPSGFHT